MAHSNILIFVHGMTNSAFPGNHKSQYLNFFDKLCQANPNLKRAFREKIFVEWGHESSNQIRSDQKIMGAENTVNSLVSYDKIKQIKDPNNKLIHDFSIFRALASVFQYPLKGKLEDFFMFGLGDVIYYCGEDGEQSIREAVYGQVLDKLRKYKKDNVELHVIAHSLGCTVAYDFLYGLFAPSKNWSSGKPDFALNKKYGKEFMEWRKKQISGELILGSMISMASQIPILLLRKQKVVDLFYQKQKLDPSVIGIKSGLRWKIFYDIDDILAYPTRNLFKSNQTIMDIQVSNTDLPHTAHEKYWINKKVIKETAELITANL